MHAGILAIILITFSDVCTSVSSFLLFPRLASTVVPPLFFLHASRTPTIRSSITRSWLRPRGRAASSLSPPHHVLSYTRRSVQICECVEFRSDDSGEAVGSLLWELYQEGRVKVENRCSPGYPLVLHRCFIDLKCDGGILCTIL